MPRPAKQVDNTAAIAAKNQNALSGFGSQSGVYDLLLSPLLDYETIPHLHWIAAGTDHSWLEITATDGFIKAKAFKSAQSAAGAWTTQKMNPRDFVCEDQYADMFNTSQDTDLRFHQYALHLALKAAGAACEREDYAMASRVMNLVTPHIPWLEQLRAMSTQLQDGDEKKSMQALGNTMQFTSGWFLCDGTSLGSLDKHGPIQPWVRANLFMQLVADSQNSLQEQFHAFNNASGDAQAYLWYCPNDDHPFSEAYGKMVLLDDAMRPVLLVSTRAQMSMHYTAANSDWDIQENNHELNHFFEWTDALENYSGKASDLCRAIAQSTPEKLVGQKLAAVLDTWMEKSANALAWEGSRVENDIIFFHSRAAHLWGLFNPKPYAVMQTLANPWDVFGQDLAQVNQWRALGQSLGCNSDLAPEQFPLPDFSDVESSTPTA